MRIAINTRFLLSHKMEGFGWYTFETTKRLVENHPEHTFILFFDRPFEERFVFGPNVIPVVLNPPARHPILFVIWFEWAVFRALKKYKADVFFSPDGYLSLRSKIPQIPVIHDLNFEHYPADIPWTARKYLRFFFPKFAKKAAKIVTVSHYSKKDIVEQYKIDPEKINVGWNGVSEVFKPIDAVEKQEMQQELAQGNPYFSFVGALHPRKNLRRLLQAFELYVQQGGEKDLVIVGENLWKSNNNYTDKISEQTKSKIHFTGHLKIEKLAKTVAASSGFVFVPYFEGFGIPLVEAMRCGIPIISGNLTSLPEVVEDAAILVNPFNVLAIANAMLQIDSNPALVAELSKLALERSKIFDWDKTTSVIWNTIQEVFEKN
jgi:glycosyltransferase involved in cell wall biosynthesis